MTLVAIRINTIKWGTRDEDGQLVDAEFDDSEEVLFECDTNDMIDVDNAITEVKDALFNWQ